MNTVERKAKKNRASTLGSYPDSQSSRALAWGRCGHLAVCANDGSITIRDAGAIDNVLVELNEPTEWCEAAEYSPDGSYLAVGSHDTNIYIYET